MNNLPALRPQSGSEEKNCRVVKTKIYAFQRKVFWEDEHIKFRIVTKGRRVGFTYGAVYYYLKKMIRALGGKEDPVRILWGDVNYTNIDKYLSELFSKMLSRTFGLSQSLWDVNYGRKELRLGDSIIDFRSATRPESWEGFGYNHIFLNEAGIILNATESARYLYENSIRPMMLDYADSRLIAGGVPKIRGGVFYELYQKALDPEQKDYKAYNFTSFDNPMLSRRSIREYEESIDELTARQEIYGEFIDKVGNPFVYAFDYDRNVGDAPDNPQQKVILAFDFNVTPMTCLVIQSYDKKIRVVREYALDNSNVMDLCNRLAAEYGAVNGRSNRITAITGDASGYGRNVLTQGNINAYVLIMRILGIGESKIKAPRDNPSVINSRMLTNAILARHPNFLIDKSCRLLIEDLKYVEADSEGKINKDKNKHQTHLLDSLRYYFNSFHPEFIRRLR
jgi:hypothetical protein